MEPLPHILLRDFRDVREILAYHGGAVGVCGVCQGAEGMFHVAVRAVEAYLFELFGHHTALYLKGVVGECEPEHAVAFKP